MVYDVTRPNRYRRARFLSFKAKTAAAAVVLAGVAGVAANVAYGGDPPAAQQIVVQPGDTLWSIAASHYGGGSDIRSEIAAIETTNRLHGGLIEPGETLALPPAA